MDDARLTVGQLAHLSGLTTKALRHYDRIGLLPPAEIDPANGYRKYAENQVATAQMIGLLRSLDVPLDEVRRLLESDDEAAIRALSVHRRNIEARAAWLRGVLHRIDHIVREGMESTMAQPTKTDPALDQATERAVAVALFNGVWKLIEQENRSVDDDARMIHMAHASCFHWLNVGAPENAARGEWMCSRVYAVLGRAEPAMFHARRALDVCERNGIGDWDLAFCHEAVARAFAVAGDPEQARQWMASARDAATRIAEDEDRKLLLSDLETIPA